MILDAVGNLSGSLSHPIVVVSGGFDPIHVGHVRYLAAANGLVGPGEIVVLVNGDGFLIRKKGYVFMPLIERMEIVNAIIGRGYVIPWHCDHTDTVSDALESIKPDYFVKGGDRSNTDIPEFETCKKLGIKLVIGAGGYDKVQSSSRIVDSVQHLKKCSI